MQLQTGVYLANYISSSEFDNESIDRAKSQVENQLYMCNCSKQVSHNVNNSTTDANDISPD